MSLDNLIALIGFLAIGTLIIFIIRFLFHSLKNINEAFKNVGETFKNIRETKNLLEDVVKEIRNLKENDDIKDWSELIEMRMGYLVDIEQNTRKLSRDYHYKNYYKKYGYCYDGKDCEWCKGFKHQEEDREDPEKWFREYERETEESKEEQDPTQ